MHIIRQNSKTIRDTKSHSFGNYEEIIVLHQLDIDNGLKILRGMCVDLILIPRTYDLEKNPDMKKLLKLSLLPNGVIKFY